MMETFIYCSGSSVRLC